MICNNCGINNNDENKFCTKCGKELSVIKDISQNACLNCGAENSPASKFCVSCGKQLFLKSKKINNSFQRKQKSKKRLRHESKNSFKKNVTRKNSFFKNLKLLWITVGVVIGTIIFISSLELIFQKNEPEVPVEQKSRYPVVEAKVYEIASKFICSCGSCNEEPLETCKCATAVEERQFIRDYLEKNQEPGDIVIAVANKYGWMKAEFASNYNVDVSRIWNPNQLQITKDVISNQPDLMNTKATISDKYTIYSAFNCPCGKCAVDELRDCTCNHPNGATEVKKFIDEKISENKYTINEIVEIVDQKYGGKKI